MCSYIQNKVEFKDIRSELNVQKYPQSPFNILVQQKNRTFQCMVMPNIMCKPTQFPKCFIYMDSSKTTINQKHEDEST